MLIAFVVLKCAKISDNPLKNLNFNFFLCAKISNLDNFLEDINIYSLLVKDY